MNNFSEKSVFLCRSLAKGIYIFVSSNTNQEEVEKFFENIGRIFRGTLTVHSYSHDLPISHHNNSKGDNYGTWNHLFYLHHARFNNLNFVTGRRN